MMNDQELFEVLLEELEEHADVGYGNKELLKILRLRVAEGELQKAIEKGTKAWEDVNPTQFVEELRGNTGEVPCKTHPDAPHGFDRNASLSEDRYVCECEYWEPSLGNTVLTVTANGEFIWHPNADEMIENGDYSSSPALKHILKALRNG